MKLINPMQSVVRVQGSVFGSDGRRRIEIKRPIYSLFSVLGDRGKLRYLMEIYLSKERFMERVKEIAGEGVLPVLVWFYRGD